jgi:DNA damage-binding protein 1
VASCEVICCCAGLETVGEFHTGAYINVLKPGSLAMRTKDAPAVDEKALLFGTREGSIGVLLPLTPQEFEFLEKVVAGGSFRHVSCT